jgi:hypothetical protein
MEDVVNQNTFTRLLRYANLSNHMLDAAKDNLNPNLKAIAPRLKSATETYQTAHAAVVTTEAAYRKEVAEANLNLAAFGRSHDGVRGVITANTPHEDTGLAASSYNTPVDLLEAAAQLAGVLAAHAQEPWAEERSVSFAAELESARREWTEMLDKYNLVQKLKAARRAAAQDLNEVLVEFRKVVKAVYGATSHEYHSLKADLRNDEAEDAEDGDDAAATPTDQTAPATPEAAQDAKAKTDKAA